MHKFVQVLYLNVQIINHYNLTFIYIKWMSETRELRHRIMIFIKSIRRPCRKLPYFYN